MKPMSTKIIFFGTEDFSLTILQGLITAGYTIAAVVTKLDSKKGRGQKLIPPPVKVLAQQHHIPVWQPTKLREITENIQALAPVAGVLASYGKIIPQSTIDLFTPGIINVHPSLLPKYRGSTPIESAIANGDSKTGVSIMQLAAAMDAGSVYATQDYPLRSTETQPELYQSLATAGNNLLLDILPRVLDGSLQPTPQNEAEATYCQLLQKSDAILDPPQLTAAQAERLVRAHLAFPKTKLTILDHSVIITKAHVTTIAKTPLDIPCLDGVFLSIDELIAPSGRTMSADSFLRGYAA